MGLGPLTLVQARGHGVPRSAEVDGRKTRAAWKGGRLPALKNVGLRLLGRV